MLNNLFVDCMTIMTVGLTMGWVGLGQKSRGLGWVLKIGPTAMSVYIAATRYLLCIIGRFVINSEVHN